MGKKCKHPTCGDQCRRPKPVKKMYRLKRFSAKRRVINRDYNAEAKEFRRLNPVCAINSPDCTKETQGVHHVKGRGKNLMNKSSWLPACNPCNWYVEGHHQWAVENGFKESRLSK